MLGQRGGTESNTGNNLVKRMGIQVIQISPEHAGWKGTTALASSVSKIQQDRAETRERDEGTGRPCTPRPCEWQGGPGMDPAVDEALSGVVLAL